MTQTSGRLETPQTGGVRLHLEPAAELLESKLGPPPTRPGTVDRPGLVGRLAEATSPIVTVLAPAGYGKTTLLGQWAERDPRPFAWVAVDERDDDPAVLLSFAVLALDRLQPIALDLFSQPPSPTGVRLSAIRRLTAAVRSMLPFVLVIDDVHHLRNPECIDVIAELGASIPTGSALVLAGRAGQPLPTDGRSRRERPFEVQIDDLILNEEQARELLLAQGVDAPEEVVAQLLEQTEGWPVALYLAALWMQRGGHHDLAVFSGDDRLMADYQRFEFLSRLPNSEVTFMTRTSLLDRLSGPVCDAMLKTKRSAQHLEELGRSNLLLVPLDRSRTWYRYHHLFRDLLRSEMERREPDRIPQFLDRAAEWCERNGQPESAIAYAQTAGDVDRVARLVVIHAQRFFARGRAATVEGWFDWLGKQAPVELYAPAAVLGAGMYALRGYPAEAERWADMVEKVSFEGSLPDGSTSLDPWVAMLRAGLCRRGPEAMRTDAEHALATIGSNSPFRAELLVLLGTAHLLLGDDAAADDAFADVIEEAERFGTTSSAVGALSQRALLAIGRGDWSQAGIMLDRAAAIIAESDTDEYVTSAIVYAASARLSAHRGDVEHARDMLVRAHRLRPLLTHALPYLSVQVLLELTQVHVALADASAARTLLREADQILRRRPALGMLVDRAVDLNEQVRTLRAGIPGASALTTAELRLLPYLSTHLSFRLIGERLHVSPHTVKSQAISIYRKLDVSSRNAAIQRALDIGLLDP